MRVGKSAAQLRERAAQYRRVAARLHDEGAQRRLRAVAAEFEADASILEADERAAAQRPASRGAGGGAH